MENGRHTRLALARSVLCAALCLALLVGTTFAWFSDEAKTGDTTVTAGNLDVELQVKQEDGSFAEADDSTALFDDTVLWEPGMMWKSGAFKVVNAGNLALQYELTLEITKGEGDADLSEVIQMKVAAASELEGKEIATLEDRRELWNSLAAEAGTDYTKGKLLPAGKDEVVGFKVGESDELAVVLFWNPSDSTDLNPEVNLDNKYNVKDGAALTADFSLNVFATQVPYESDSFGERYDDVAVAASEAEINEALEALPPGGTLYISGEVKMNDPFYVDKDLTIKPADGGTALRDAVIEVAPDAAGEHVSVTIEDMTFTGNSYINTEHMGELTVRGCEAEVDAYIEGNNGNRRAAFITIGTAETDRTPLKLDIRDNRITVAGSGADSYPCAIFGWAYVADGSVISGNILGSAEVPYTFVAVKLMNFADGANVTISDNTVYGKTTGYGFYAFDMYQNTSLANSYTATFLRNTVMVDRSLNPAEEAMFADLECNQRVGEGHGTLYIGEGNTFNGEPVGGEHILIEKETYSPGRVEFIGR